MAIAWTALRVLSLPVGTLHGDILLRVKIEKLQAARSIVVELIVGK